MSFDLPLSFQNKEDDCTGNGLLDEIKQSEAAARKLLTQWPYLTTFGLLMLRSRHHPMALLLKEKWEEIHVITGYKFLFMLLQQPADLLPVYRSYWEEKLGGAFHHPWQDLLRWQQEAAETHYDEMCRQMGCHHRHFACLVLFTDPTSPKAVVRPLPAWDVNNMYHFLLGVTEEVYDCCALPADQRLIRLRDSLSSKSTRFMSQFKNSAFHVGEYLSSNQASITFTNRPFMSYLCNERVLPLSLSMIEPMLAVRETYHSTEAENL